MNFARVNEIRHKVNRIDLSSYTGDQESYKYRITKLEVKKFRHIKDCEINFTKPVSIITAKNKVGKTSLLLLIACSHEKFLRIDSTSPSSDVREHSWKDVIRFTSHENTTDDYEYSLSWRFAAKALQRATGKRLASTRAWSGLGKKSRENRLNCKIKQQEVRYVDLERVTPARNFSESLFKKAIAGQKVRLSAEIEECFQYITQTPGCVISRIGSHINKVCYLIETPTSQYSSYNAAIGEENLISLLIDLIDSPQNTLILIDEIDAGLHPEFQRRLADVIYLISWNHKKQFIITTHSPSLISAFGKDSRIVLSSRPDASIVSQYSVSKEYAIACMDSEFIPLIRLYCEDDLSEFIIKRYLLELHTEKPSITKMLEIIPCGPGNKVVDCFNAHKHVFSLLQYKQGYCAIFDGDFFDKAPYQEMVATDGDHCSFLLEGERPEKYLINKYLESSPNATLQASLELENHHQLFNKMVDLGLAADENSAKEICYSSFKQHAEFTGEIDKFKKYITRLLSLYEI